MVISNVDNIEAVGGGSCRCMLVENWSTIESSTIYGEIQEKKTKKENFDHIINTDSSSATSDNEEIEESLKLFRVKKVGNFDENFF